MAKRISLNRTKLDPSYSHVPEVACVDIFHTQAIRSPPYWQMNWAIIFVATDNEKRVQFN